MPRTPSFNNAPPIPANEDERLAELRSLDLLDTAHELRFDRYTNLVAEIFAFPVVLVTLVDRDRQWFKSMKGIDFRETSRNVSFCAHAINQHGVMVVPDAAQDPRFADNPLVTGHPYIRFYAGAPVHGPSGKPLGTMCVIDGEPRTFDENQCRLLRQFADLLEQEIRHTHDLKMLRASVEHSAYYDALTGLPNRRLLIDRLGQLIQLAESESRRVAVLLFNVTGLRLINQSFGSETGDGLLRELGDRLIACCPAGGSVARLQADEFVMAFPTFAEDHDHIDAVIENANAVIEKPFLGSDGEHYLNVQVGGSVFPEHGSRPEALIERASAAIRFVGKGGHDAIRFFTREESASISERLRIESRLRAAISQCQFRLVYQPIVSLKDGRLAGLEALIRWHDKELGEVCPSQFIPIAEQSGLITAVDDWVMGRVCEQICQWRQGSEWRIPVAVNVSAPELVQADYARCLLQRLEKHKIPPELLWLEVTERSLVADSPLVTRNLALLKDASIYISIDDFGTGYSSLAYLRRMPLQRIKIDRSFVSGLPLSDDDATLTRTVINMAKGLGLSTVGEGVETVEQLEFLRQNHCDYAQGFLIATPLEAEQIPSLCTHPLI